MKRVYVAGAYSADNMVDLLANMRRGIDLAMRAWNAGFAPFTPWLDLLLHMQPCAAGLDIHDCYDMSMKWLEVSDAVLVQVMGADKSVGTQAEIARAEKLGIPVFWTLAELIEWKNAGLIPTQECEEKREWPVLRNVGTGQEVPTKRDN